MKRQYPDQPVVGVGSVIIKEGNIALIKRGNEPAKEKWTIPGGLVELGESPEEAVIRETKEEVGVNVEKPELIDVVSYVDLDNSRKVKYHYIIIDYFVQVKSGKLEASIDAQELSLVPFERVEEFDLTKSFREFFINNRKRLEKLNSYL